MKKDLTLFWVLLSGVFTGSVYPLIKIAENYGVPKFAYIFWESVFVTVLAFSIGAFRRGKPLPIPKEWKYYVFCAFTNILISQFLIFIIAPNLPVGVYTTITVLTPMMVYGLLLVFCRETFYLYKGVGLLFGFIGTVILFLPSLVMDQQVFDWLWVVFALLVPFDYAVNRVIASRLMPQNSSPYRLTVGLFFTVALVSGVFLVGMQQYYVPSYPFHAGDMAIFAHAFIMTLFYLVFFVLAEKGAVQNSLAFYVAPLTGILVGVLFFDESLEWWFLLSTAFIFYGLYLVNKKKNDS